jgi:hypothetical protein
MTRWSVLPRFGSCKPTPRWGGHKDRVSFNPFPLSNGHLDRVSFLPWLWFDRRLWFVSWSVVYCSCIEWGVVNAWMPWRVVVGRVFIAPTTNMAVGEGFSEHCPVRQPRHQAVGFRPLELWLVGPPDSPVVHRTGPVDCPVHLLLPALTSACAGAHYLLSLFTCRRPLARSSRCSAGTPDSPVLHRTVRCYTEQSGEL